MNVETLRGGYKALIAASPTAVSIYRREQVDGGFGRMVEKADGGTLLAGKARVRIPHASSAVQGNADQPQGFGADLALYVITDYTAPLIEGDTISDGTTYWRVGPVNLLKEGRKVYGTEAPLTIVDRSSIEPLSDGGDVLGDDGVVLFAEGDA